MTGDNHNLPKGLLEKIEQAKQEKEVISQANSVPLPGALRDAFSPQQDIVVGKYSVRAFYDLDFEILQQIDHPSHFICQPFDLGDVGGQARPIAQIHLGV